jgi:type III secretion protein V
MLRSLNAFARLASDRSEVVGASLLLIMITMMVIPLSPELLDILIALNIAATVVLVLSAVLLDTPLSFSSFPAILLMTTLFRLSLNISTTRQILLEADAGEIVQTFGQFVVGGNLAVGLVVFLIISVVNFLVITKGSERVAEVAARFSLDAMPGKQMSIDGDLRNGALTNEQAKKKRADLEKESQLFGAMDGAIKFVKNDAIAGLVITLINLLGGLAIGMLQHDMTFSESGKVYTILSVGDGLISIIPSLMTSIAAGLIVTRVTKGESDGSNTAQDIIKELVANPTALQISGFFCFLFAFVPGMPAYVFFILAGLLWFRALKSSKPQEEQQSNDPAERFEKMLSTLSEKKGSSVEDLMSANVYSALEVLIPNTLEPNDKSLIFSILKFSRNQLVEESGVVYPVPQFRDDDKVSQVQILVFGVPLLTLDMSDKRLMVFGEKEKLESLGDSVKLEYDSALGRSVYYCVPTFKPVLDSLALKSVYFEKRWAQMFSILLYSKVKDFFTLNDVQKHIASLNSSHAELIKELLRVLPASKLTDVFQNLLKERVSIRNANLILAGLIDWGQRERDSNIISEQIRRILFEQISHQLSVSGELKVLSLDNTFEQFIRESVRSDGVENFLDIDATSQDKVVRMIEKQFEPWSHFENLPIVVCSMDVRQLFRGLIADRLKAVSVMSYQEISPNKKLKLLGTINFDESLVDSNQDMAD